MFNCLILKKNKVTHNPYKSECFSLGVILLEQGLGKSV